MRRLAPSLLALLTLGVATGPAARAWGPLGHEIACEIAFQELGEAARDEVKRLIRLDPEYSTFAAACNWPDSPKRREVEHWVNFPRQTPRVRSSDCPLATKCLFTGIRRSRTLLAKASTGDAQRLEELKFLGHWIGNLHQPMHVSFKDDRGGNSVDATGVCEGNLHWVWDSCIAGERLRPRGSVREIARQLRRTYAAELPAWRGGDEVQWADESFQLAIEPSVGYCFQRPGGCWYSMSRKSYRSAAGKRTVTVNAAYIDRHLGAVERRLTQAGVRLAAELDRWLPRAP